MKLHLFPPQDLRQFLALCDGTWLTLRSRFDLNSKDLGENGDEWHSSEKGELLVSYLEPRQLDHPGGLAVTSAGAATLKLQFSPEGEILQDIDSNSTKLGEWQFWADGSLELVASAEGNEVRERIWFTKANLRLRSCIVHAADGQPGLASFHTDIRRVSRPAQTSA